MPANDNIDDILSQQAVDQFELLKKLTKAAIEDMATLSQSARQAFDGLAKSTTLKDLIGQTQAASEANKGMIDSTKILIDIRKQADDILAKNNGHSVEYVKVLKDTAIAHKTATQELIIQTKEQERLDAAQQKAALGVAKQRDAYFQLNAQYKDAAALAKSLGAEYYSAQQRGETWTESQVAGLEQAKAKALELRLALFGINKGIGDNSLNVGNYAEGILEAQRLRKEMDAVAVAAGKDSTEFKNLSGQLGTLTSSLGGTRGQLTWVVGQMDTLAASGQKDSEEFERLTILAAELKAEMNSVGASIKEASASMERGALSMEAFADTMKELGGFIIAFFGIQAGMEFISGIAEEFGKADDEARKLKNTLDNNQASSALVRVNEQVKEITEEFKYLDDYEVQGVFDKLITYGKLSEKQMKELIPVIIDYAAKEKISVEQSAEVMVKALEGSGKALKAYGINIKDAAEGTETAASPAERLSLIMKELKPRVEGAAAAFSTSFEGGLGNIKRTIREIELSISDLFVKLSGVDDAAQNAAVKASQEASNGQKLIDEYEELSKKVNQTADDKKRLGEITVELGNIFGNSVLSIDAETNSLQLNLEKTKELIKQRLLLADQRSVQLANDYNAAKIQQEMAEKQIAIDKQRYAAVPGGGQVNLNNGSPGRVPGGLPGIDIIVDFEEQTKRLAEAIEKRKEALKKLQELGHSEEDVNRLFNPDDIIKPRGDLNAGGKDKKAKSTVSDDLAAQYAAEKEFNDAVAELAKARYKIDADTQQLIFENEKETLQKRLDAYDQFQKDQIAIATIENGRELADLETKQKEIEARIKASDDGKLKLSKIQYQALITEDLAYDLKITAAEEALQNAIAAIALTGRSKKLAIVKSSNQEWLRIEETGLQDRIQDFEIQYDKEKELLDKSLSAKLLTSEEYEKKLKALRQASDVAILTDQIAEYQYELKNDQLTADEKLTIQTKLNAAVRSLRDKASTQALDDLKKQEAAKKTLQDKEWEGVNAAFDLGKELVDSYYQKQLDYEQKLLTAIEQKKTAQEDYINTSMLNDQEKAKATQALNASTALQEQQIQENMTRIKREQAIADRVAAILKIAEGIAQAEAAALTLLSTPVTAALYPETAGLIAGTGAAEIAAVLAQPMPQYWKGTPKDAIGHPGGLALLGDGYEPEAVFEPGKAPYWSADVPTVYDLKRNARVIPESELLANSLGFMTPSLLQSLNLVNNNDFSALENATNQGFSRLEKAIINKKETHFNWHNGQLVKSVKRGNSWTTYANKNKI